MVKAVKLRRLLEAARRDRAESRFWGDLEEGLGEGHLSPGEFRIRDLFENFVDDGHEIVQSWGRPGDAREGERGGVTLQEAGVDTSAFSNITGQIVFSTILEAWNNPMFIADQLARTVPTSFLDGEKVPGISNLGDEAEEIGEGQNYPLAGVNEEYVETPRTTKNGLIVPVTKEAVIADRTGVILDRAGDVTQSLRINKEKRVIDVAVGVTNTYKRNGVSINTYGDVAGDKDFDNLQGSNALADWTDVENALLLFDGMTDPNTGEPIMVNAVTLLVPTALVGTAWRIRNATEVRHGSDPIVISGNPLTELRNVSGQLNILSNAWVKARTSSATTWFAGDPMRAFRYMEVWPITSVRAPMNSELEFTHDIVERFKVSERGAAAVFEPRYMTKNTAA